MNDYEILLRRICEEAERQEFPIDISVYKSAGKIPTEAILSSGKFNTQICFFGRDLGRDEVIQGQPLIGASGMLVRKEFYRTLYSREIVTKDDVQSICRRALLTNTVPYKPPGNKAYSHKVKERFRPFIEQLLVVHWQGNQIITLGTEAFKWFSPYCEAEKIEEFWKRPDRYELKFTVILKATDFHGKHYERKVHLLPLPHPSPLNKQYYARFPQMLRKRLNEFEF